MEWTSSLIHRRQILALRRPQAAHHHCIRKPGALYTYACEYVDGLSMNYIRSLIQQKARLWGVRVEHWNLYSTENFLTQNSVTPNIDHNDHFGIFMAYILLRVLFARRGTDTWSIPDSTRARRLNWPNTYVVANTEYINIMKMWIESKPFTQGSLENVQSLRRMFRLLPRGMYHRVPRGR